jgi:hypothetical protein
MNYSNTTSSGYVALPPADVLKIMILQRRSDVISKIRSFYERKENGSRGAEHVLVSEVRALWFEIESGFMRDDPTHAEEIIALLWSDSNKGENSIKAFRKINKWLDQKSITRVDLKKEIDRTRVELENDDKDL